MTRRAQSQRTWCFRSSASSQRSDSSLPPAPVIAYRRREAREAERKACRLRTLDRLRGGQPRRPGDVDAVEASVHDSLDLFRERPLAPAEGKSTFIGCNELQQTETACNWPLSALQQTATNCSLRRQAGTLSVRSPQPSLDSSHLAGTVRSPRCLAANGARPQLSQTLGFVWSRVLYLDMPSPDAGSTHAASMRPFSRLASGRVPPLRTVKPKQRRRVAIPGSRRRVGCQSRCHTSRAVKRRPSSSTARVMTERMYWAQRAVAS